ncbi:MAG: coproporphyrinogen dehydrogenase HemZ [Lawsonibacter sp.]|jgi:oxygen-independent coproporphyrinogen-3 oxidase
MKLVLKGHEERYVVEQGMLNLFPQEKPVYGQLMPEDTTWAVVELKEEAAVCQVQVEVCWEGKTACHQLQVPLDGTAYQREGQRRRAIGRCFFLAAQGVTGRTMPWGMLTGVRPVKLPTRALQAGASPQQARRELEEVYRVSPVRAKLALDCAQASLDVQRSLREREVSVYVGIPFCPTRCAYCSFVSADVGRTLHLVEPYLEGVEREIIATAQALTQAGLTVRSFYMGGGTPTTLSASQMDRLLRVCREHLPLSDCTEYTVEAGRPDTITREKLEVLRNNGIDRISINPQTLEGEVLSAIGRKHSPQDILDAYAQARAVGFSCINMDLIAGLPRDSFAGFCRSLNGVLALDPENVTVHTLAMKKGSTLMEQGGAVPGGEEVERMLEFSLNELRGTGYRPYYLYRQKYMSGALENVGWSKPGHESLYNIVMMEELHTVVSIGGGGVTKLIHPHQGKILRLANPKFPQDYLAGLEKVLAQKQAIPAFYQEHKLETSPV